MSRDIPILSGRGARRVSLGFLRWYGRSFPMDRGKGRIIDAYLHYVGVTTDHHRTADLRLAPARMHCDLREFIQQRIYFRGTYERRSEALWVSIARRSKTLFDVGANVGLFSLLGAATNTSIKVHAFEPTPTAANTLDANIQLNGFGSVVLNRVAVGKASGVLYLHEFSGADGSNGGMNFTTEEALGAAGQVPVVSLDDYCRDKGINHIDALKVDVEGAEYDVFAGSAHLLRYALVDYVLFESVEWTARRFGRSRAAAEHLLANAGYTIYDVETRECVPAGGAQEGNLIACAPACTPPW